MERLYTIFYIIITWGIIVYLKCTIQTKCSVHPIFIRCILHCNSRYTLLTEDVSLYLVLSRSPFFVFFFSSYSIPSFLNVIVLHYNVSSKSVYNQTSSWLLVGYCTAYVAVTLYFHPKRLKEDKHKRL
jgi:hypothetical protein